MSDNEDIFGSVASSVRVVASVCGSEGSCGIVSEEEEEAANPPARRRRQRRNADRGKLALYWVVVSSSGFFHVEVGEANGLSDGQLVVGLMIGFWQLVNHGTPLQHKFEQRMRDLATIKLGRFATFFVLYIVVRCAVLENPVVLSSDSVFDPFAYLADNPRSSVIETIYQDELKLPLYSVLQMWQQEHPYSETCVANLSNHGWLCLLSFTVSFTLSGLTLATLYVRESLVADLQLMHAKFIVKLRVTLRAGQMYRGGRLMFANIIRRSFRWILFWLGWMLLLL